MRVVVVGGRLLLAVVLLASLVASAVASAAGGRPLFDFFWFFGTQSTLLAVVALAGSAILLQRRAVGPEWWDLLRGAAVASALVLVACRPVLALPWQPSSGYPLPVCNVVVTLVGPVLLLLDWSLIGDRRGLTGRFVRWAALYPVLWTALTLLRGIATGWGPYPMLRPETAGLRTPLYLIGTCAVAVIGASVAVLTSRRYMGWGPEPTGSTQDSPGRRR